MTPRMYFPLGKAYDQAFCNRVSETQWLVGNLENVKHSLLLAPRRYGKSSLAERAIAKIKFPAIKINFHLCTTEEEVAQMIINNIIRLIGQSIGRAEKIIASVKKYVENLQPTLTFDNKVAKLQLIPEQHVNRALIITEALLLIEKLLKEKNKKAIIFFDEFQEIVKISKDTNIEGAIRTAAQDMQNLAIIFSGSMRSLLSHMFEDERRPLYKLCRKLKLERIASDDYKKHLNKIAVKTWKEQLPEPTFNKIMSLSKRHPYYVNYLCDILWEENKRNQLPAVDDVVHAWSIVIDEEWGDILREISILALSQRKILKFIATRNAVNMTSHENCTELKMPASSISSALNVLIERDYIEIDRQGSYQIINPVLATVLDLAVP